MSSGICWEYDNKATVLLNSSRPLDCEDTQIPIYGVGLHKKFPKNHFTTPPQNIAFLLGSHHDKSTFEEDGS